MLELLPLVGIALIFWLLLIRPAQKQRKELARMQSALAVGDDVLLTSGIHGTVRDLEDATVSVEVSPGVVLRVARGAIGAVVPPAQPEPAHDEELEAGRDDASDVSPGAGPEER